MSPREQLRRYIEQLHRRLQWHAGLRGAAVCAASALVATVALVAVTNYFAFSSASMNGARLFLLAILAIAAGVGLWWPLRRLSRSAAIRRAESRFPELAQRLSTFHDCDVSSPFADLLAEDTLRYAPEASPERLAPSPWLYSAAGAGVACLGVLIWMIAAAPGYWGYGAALLWTGPRSHAQPMYALLVQPGNALIRRHGDQMITAAPHGLASPAVQLFARYQSASRWEAAPMRAQASAGGKYQYLFAGLPEDVDYYVVAGALRSPVYHLRVRDLPAVKQIAVNYHYPDWTGMKDATDPHAGDLRAVAGTRADLHITTDQPLQGGELVLDNGQTVALTAEGNNRYQGSLTLAKDGLYHVAAVVPGEDPSLPTRLSEDYFIAAPPAAPPQVALVRPDRDYRASPIEEVTVSAQANDQYGLKDFALHYSVNGGPEKTVDLLHGAGAKNANGSTVLSFEDFKAQPGDLVSVYASARDGAATARTDMVFIQADPFEREFSQSQQSGGGGGGGGGQGNQSAQIADREKEIIAATFRQQNDKTASAELAADTAKLLSQSQSTLHDQATSLSGRLQSRELTNENQAFSDFQKDMDAAAQAMAPAATSLQGEKWPAAIPNEEKALRYLLRADATFRQIQVAFGARGGGGGGGGSAARDLASLFDLELDTQKNQYETQQTASTSEQKAQQIDDTLKKLDELAQRQQDLAQQRNGTPSAEQRWQQDLLRREAQQLQQQLQQLASNQNGQSGQSGQSSQSGQSEQSGQSGQSGQGGQSASASGSSGASGQSPAQAQAAQAAADALRRAAQAMQSGAGAQQAAAALRQAYQALASLQQQNAGGRLGAMADQANQIASAQKQQADQIRQMIAKQQQASEQALNQMIQRRQQLSDQLEQLEKTIRNAAGDLNGTQPAASSKLRDALDGMDSADLTTRMQRSSDWLRNGNFSDAGETSLTNDLQKLGQQLSQAQRALGASQSDTNAVALDNAMSRIEQLRQQIAGLGTGNSNGGRGNPGSANGRNGPAGQQYQTGQLGRSAGNNVNSAGGRNGGNGGGNNGANGGANGANNNGGANGRNGVIGDRLAGNAGQRNGNAGGYNDGQVGNAAGGYRDRNGNGGFDMGNTHIVGQAVAPQQGPNPADTERQIQQDVAALNQLRQALPKDAETQRELQSLIQQMQGLDPSRFPGNPAMVAEMHQELLTSVDTLELQLRRRLDATAGGQIRAQAPVKAPDGYADAVADYYRRLSGGGNGGGH